MVPICDAAEVTRLDTELAKQKTLIDVGVGILDLRTGVVRLCTYDETDAFSRANRSLQVMAGHEAAAAMACVPQDQARGFILGKSGSDWLAYNQSHLNKADGQNNPMQMDPLTFNAILAALGHAGVQNPIVP